MTGGTREGDGELLLARDTTEQGVHLCADLLQLCLDLHDALALLLPFLLF